MRNSIVISNKRPLYLTQSNPEILCSRNVRRRIDWSKSQSSRVQTNNCNIVSECESSMVEESRKNGNFNDRVKTTTSFDAGQMPADCQFDIKPGDSSPKKKSVKLSSSNLRIESKVIGSKNNWEIANEKLIQRAIEGFNEEPSELGREMYAHVIALLRSNKLILSKEDQDSKIYKLYLAKLFDIKSVEVTVRKIYKKLVEPFLQGPGVSFVKIVPDGEMFRRFELVKMMKDVRSSMIPKNN